MAATVYTLDGTAAKLALALEPAGRGAVVFRRGAVARIAAALVDARHPDRAVDPAAARAPACGVRRRRCVQGFRRAPAADLVLYRRPHRRAARLPAGASIRRGAIPGGKVRDPPGAELGCRSTRMTRRCRCGWSSARRARRCSRCWSGCCGCASARRRGRRLYAAAAGGSLAAALAVAFAGLGHLAGMVARHAGPGAVRDAGLVRVAARTPGATPPPRRGWRACGR